MFVALRDLAHARGRFLLMTVVVALVTFLVTVVASLTAGLARESTSAVTGLDADLLVFGMPSVDDAPDFTASRVTDGAASRWRETPGIDAVTPVGIAMARAEAGDAAASVAVIGLPPASAVQPDVAVEPGRAALSAGAAHALGVDTGDRLLVGGRSWEAHVTGVDASFSHAPAVWIPLDAWRDLPGAGGAGADGPAATVLAVTGGAEPAAIEDAAAATDTVTATPREARAAIASFVGENTSLTLMQGFLVVISALVVGAFFTVWTIGRTGEIAVLKALGSSNRYLVRDAMGQAGAVLLIGVAAGSSLTALAAALLPAEVPVAAGVTTVALPALGLIALGLAGAAIAIARIVRVDPHAALAAR